MSLLPGRRSLLQTAPLRQPRRQPTQRDSRGSRRPCRRAGISVRGARARRVGGGGWAGVTVLLETRAKTDHVQGMLDFAMAELADAPCPKAQVAPGVGGVLAGALAAERAALRTQFGVAVESAEASRVDCDTVIACASIELVAATQGRTRCAPQSTLRQRAAQRCCLSSASVTPPRHLAPPWEPSCARL